MVYECVDELILLDLALALAHSFPGAKKWLKYSVINSWNNERTFIWCNTFVKQRKDFHVV